MACQVRIQVTASMAVLLTCGLLLFDKMAVFIYLMPRTSMSVIRKTFGGLSAAYYIRYFLIGLIFYIFIIFDFGGSKENPNYWSIMMTFTACQLLYPYAYFVYDHNRRLYFGRSRVLFCFAYHVGCADFCRDSVLVWCPNHRTAWFGLAVLGTWQAGAMNRIL